MAIKASEQITISDITDAYSVILTNETYTFVGNTSGAPSGLSCKTSIVAYCGFTLCPKVTISTVQCPTGISAAVSNNGSSSPTITFTTTSTITSACEATIPVSVDGVTINKKFSFAVAKQGSTGAAGKGVKSTAVTYQAAANGTTVPTGTWSTSVPATSADKPYLWTRTIITYTDDTTSTSYSIGSTPEGIVVGGRNLLIGSGKLAIGEGYSGQVRYGELYPSYYNGCHAVKTTRAWDGYGFNLSKVMASSGLNVGDEVTYSIMVMADGIPLKNLSFTMYRAGPSSIPVTNIAIDDVVPNQWFELYVTFPVPENYEELPNTRLESSYYEDKTDYSTTQCNIWFACPKLERGNKPTDWTPAPEDMATTDDVSGLEDRVYTSIGEKEASILSTSEEIILSALESYVETNNYDEFKQTVETQLAVMSDEITMNFSTTTEHIESVDDNLQEKFSELNKHISFSENGISISSGENAMSIRIDNDLVIFEKNGVQFGWWDGIDFHTGNIMVEVTERAQFGNFAFVPRSDGSLSFLKVENRSGFYVILRGSLMVIYGAYPTLVDTTLNITDINGTLDGTTLKLGE